MNIIQQRKTTQVKKDVTAFEYNAYNKSVISTPSCILSSSGNRERQLSYIIYKKSTQKQPSCKKGTSLCKMASMKKL